MYLSDLFELYPSYAFCTKINVFASFNFPRMISPLCLQTVYSNALSLIQSNIICTKEELWIYYADMNSLMHKYSDNESVLVDCMKHHIESEYINTHSNHTPFQTIPVLIVVLITTVILYII